jgi:hypothetical protein
MATAAFADTLESDTDGLIEPAFDSANRSVAFGSVCQDAAVSQTILLAVNRQGGAAGNTFKNSSTVTVTKQAQGGDPGASATMGSANTIDLPDDWVADGDLSDAVSATIELDTSAPTVGEAGGNFTFRASGTASNSTTAGSLTTDRVVTWTGTVLASTHANCTSTPANTAPVADAGGPYAGGEGEAISLSLATATDADSDPLSYGWTIDYNGNIDAGGSCSFNSATDLNPTVTCTDDSGTGTFTLTLTVDDGVNDPVSDTAALTVSNVAPSFDTGNPAFATASVSCLNNTVTLHFAFSDDGSNDTHTASINWGDGSAVQNLNETDTAAETATHTYNSGGPYTASINVTDDDGDATGATNTTNTLSVLFNTSGILQPINADGSSGFKISQTIPVKATFTDCDGNLPSSNPTVHLRKIANGTGEVVTEVVSSSAADTGNEMRFTETQYIFNLSTKKSQFNAGRDLTEGRYELTIKIGGVTQITVEFGLRR